MTNQLDLAILAGALFATGLYLALDRGFLRSLLGFITLAGAANVVVLSGSGDPSGRSAPVLDGASAPPADPLPQALILTAIVIGFGVTAYLTVLYYRVHTDTRGMDLDEAEPCSDAGDSTEDEA